MELKAFDLGLGRYLEDGSPCVVAFDADGNPRLLNEKVYLKSEADKVIAEKDKEIRHQKYKRCLDMAKWCYSMDCRMLNEASDNGTYFKESWCWKRASWYGKWKRKWLELAENFKEA